jgi:hypothetical protein
MKNKIINLIRELDKLVYKKLISIEYYSEISGLDNIVYPNIDLQNIPMSGVKLVFNFNYVSNIIESNYLPFGNFGGLDINQTERNEIYRPNQIKTIQNKKFFNKEFLKYRIINNLFIINGKEHNVPFGIEFIFEDNLKFWIYNIGIESYSSKNMKYEFSIANGEFTIFYNEKYLFEYSILNGQTFNI